MCTPLFYLTTTSTSTYSIPIPIPTPTCVPCATHNSLLPPHLTSPHPRVCLYVRVLSSKPHSDSLGSRPRPLDDNGVHALLASQVQQRGSRGIVRLKYSFLPSPCAFDRLQERAGDTDTMALLLRGRGLARTWAWAG